MLDEKKIRKFLQSAFARFHPTSTFKYCMFIHWQFKMAEAEDFATMILLNELMDSEDEKPKRGKLGNGSKGERKEVFLQTLFKN